MACCPAHEDKNPSLSVKENDHGDVLLNCFAGCKPQAVVSAIGLEMKDLYSMPLTNGNGGSHFKSAADREFFFNKSVSLSNLPTAKQIEKRLNGSTADRVEGLGARLMTDVKTEPIDWLWFPLVPLYMLTLIDGAEGIGKTFLLLAFAAAVTTGRGLPGVKPEDHPPAGNVLLVMPEDIASVIKQRLLLMGADLSRIYIIDQGFSLSDPDGVLRFSHEIGLSGACLVVLDPLFALVGGRLDLNSDNQGRSITSELKRLAEKHRCAIVCVRHLNKSKGMGDPRAAGLNGVGWRAAARSALIVGANPENERERAIVQTKTNLTAESSQSIGFVIDHEGFHWTGPSKLTASMMLSLKQQETPFERGAREEAREFLKEILRGRPMDSKEVMKEAKDAGLSESTIRRAKTDLGIKPKKIGLDHWEWSLP